MMPEVNGYEVMEKLKENVDTADIPIIICTAKYLEKDDIESLDRNVLCVMQKGKFSKEKLIECISKLQQEKAEKPMLDEAYA